MGKVSAVVAVLLCGTASFAQQKGQWVPGQFGLNAGVIPEPGITYQNLALNYSAGRLNDSNGNALPGFSGNYQFWIDEVLFFKYYNGQNAKAHLEGDRFVFGGSRAIRIPKS